jgi:hypothetical protein
MELIKLPDKLKVPCPDYFSSVQLKIPAVTQLFLQLQLFSSLFDGLPGTAQTLGFLLLPGFTLAVSEGFKNAENVSFYLIGCWMMSHVGSPPKSSASNRAGRQWNIVRQSLVCIFYANISLIALIFDSDPKNGFMPQVGDR